jgi:hypothetical protein
LSCFLRGRYHIYIVDFVSFENIVLPWEITPEKAEDINTETDDKNNRDLSFEKSYFSPERDVHTPEPPKPKDTLISEIAKTIVDLKMMSPDIKLFNSPAYNSITVYFITVLIKVEQRRIRNTCKILFGKAFC